MTLDTDARRLVAQLLHALRPIGGGPTVTRPIKTDQVGMFDVPMTEGEHATARAAVDAARAALGYPGPEDAPLSNATRRRLPTPAEGLTA